MTDDIASTQKCNNEGNPSRARISISETHLLSKQVFGVTSLVTAFTLITVCSTSHAVGDIPENYHLDRIVQLALERNPVVAGAQASIDQSAGRPWPPAPIPTPRSAETAAIGNSRCRSGRHP